MHPHRPAGAMSPQDYLIVGHPLRHWFTDRTRDYTHMKSVRNCSISYHTCHSRLDWESSPACYFPLFPGSPVKCIARVHRWHVRRVSRGISFHEMVSTPDTLQQSRRSEAHILSFNKTVAKVCFSPIQFDVYSIADILTGRRQDLVTHLGSVGNLSGDRIGR